MSVVSVEARSFILALFIRDDGERFLLGDNGYDFIDSQLHFVANTIENDEVEKQGADGVMLAGQVRRASVQTFDGYVGDATTPKDKVEEMRREFIAFFAKNHHFRVIYVDCNRNAWQRKGGYLVDAPEVKELWQIHPEYHVGLNFEDVNYYEYGENAEGQEILANIMKVPISSDVEGGLVWDEDGAVSEDATVVYDGDTATASGKSISVSDAVEAPLSDFKLKGGTSQNGTPTPDAPVAVQTVTGGNEVRITGKNLFDGSIYKTGYIITNDGSETANANYVITNAFEVKPNTKYTTSGNFPASAGDDYIRVAFYDANMVFLVRYSVAVPYTITSPADAKYARLSYHKDGTKIQFEEGEEVSPYEEPQVYELNLGKNLFDVSAIPYVAKRAYGADGSELIWSNYTGIDGYQPVAPSTTYTLTNEKTNGVSYLCEYDGNKNFIQRSTNQKTFTTTANTHYLRWSIYSAGEVAPTQTQLEKGSQATSYAAYFEPIELCKLGNAQDYIFKSGDKWYVHKAVGKLNCGDYTWSWDSSIPRVSLSTAGMGVVPPGGNQYPFLAYSNKFKADTFTHVYTEKNNGMAISTSGFIYLVDTSWTSEAEANSDIQDAVIYYALQIAYRTDIEITNEALTEQLEAILSQGYTYAGTNNITTVISAGNEQGELEITYYTKYNAKVVGGGYVWEAGGSGGPTVVTNESISAVSPVWTVFGPALNPMLENATTGEQIQYVGMIGEGQTLVVDMGEQTARLDGLNVISNIVGEYLTLAPGSNTLLFSAEGDAPASEIGWSEIVG